MTAPVGVVASLEPWQSEIPRQLKTREEQEAWAAVHAPPWELDRERFLRRLDERARAFSKGDPKPVDREGGTDGRAN